MWHFQCVYAHSKLELREPDERYKAAVQQQNCSSPLTHTTQPHLGEDVVTAGADYTESHDYQWLQVSYIIIIILLFRDLNSRNNKENVVCLCVSGNKIVLRMEHLFNQQTKHSFGW